MLPIKGAADLPYFKETLYRTSCLISVSLWIILDLREAVPVPQTARNPCKMSWKKNDSLICDGYVTCAVKSGDILYINFIHSVMAALGLYLEELDTDSLLFWWSYTAKIHRI